MIKDGYKIVVEQLGGSHYYDVCIYEKRLMFFPGIWKCIYCCGDKIGSCSVVTRFDLEEMSDTELNEWVDYHFNLFATHNLRLDKLNKRLAAL